MPTADSGRPVALILTPTPNEHKAVKKHLEGVVFEHFRVRVVECGPGRLNVGFVVARELFGGPSPKDGGDYVVIGAGTSGSLSSGLKRGDVIVSRSALISDWRMEDGGETTLSPYAWFDYRPPTGEHVEKMAIVCGHPGIATFMERIPADGFKKGRLLTSEAFVSGKELKLESGRKFGCLACDMESGAVGFIGENLMRLPWFNVRVVADTLDDDLSDYFSMEKDVSDVLGRKLAEALRILDAAPFPGK